MLLREHLAASPFSPWTHTNAEYLPSLLVCSHFGHLTRFSPLRIVTSVTSEGLVRSPHLDVYFRMLAWRKSHCTCLLECSRNWDGFSNQST